MQLVFHQQHSRLTTARLQVVDMLQARFEQQLPELAGVPVLPLSALTGSGTAQLLPAVMAAYDVWTRRVPTSRLNRWLEKVAIAVTQGWSHAHL